MNHYISTIYILIFTVSLATTIFTIPYIEKLGHDFKLIDLPNQRKQHNKPLVRVGGIGILAGYLIAYFGIGLSSYFFGNFIAKEEFLILTGTCLIAIFCIGFADDIIRLSPWTRLASEILVASYAWFNGMRIQVLDLSFNTDISNQIILIDSISFIITILWLVGLTNAINWMDGLDGLAAGLAAISCLYIAFFSNYFNNTTIACLALGMSGSCLGFLRYNINPARILMGDGGSYLLGFGVASLSILGCASKGFNGNSEALAMNIPICFLILFVPIVDMTKVIITRVSKGISPFFPDRNHIHHQLINLGLTQKKAVFLIYTISIWFGGLALFTLNIGSSIKLFLLPSSLLLYTLLDYFYKHYRIR